MAEMCSRWVSAAYRCFASLIRLNSRGRSDVSETATPLRYVMLPSLSLSLHTP